MKKKLLVLMLLFWLGGGAQAQQDEKVAALLSEREQLVLEYQFYNQQNSNFWGKKSKKDLLNIIETLKKIINHDSRLVAAINEASLKKIAETTVKSQRSGSQLLEDERQINKRIAELQSQVNTLASELKKRDRTVLDLQAEVQTANEVRFGKDRVIAILAVVAFILFAYAVFVQVRLSRALAGNRKKKRA